MKTKKQIINETVKYYSKHPRAIQDSGCYYLTTEGNMCAIGRCLNKNFLDKNHEVLNELGNLEFVVEEFGNIIHQFKPSYKIDDFGFWESLQMFHDENLYWSSNGLTTMGKIAHQKLLEKYAN